METSGNTETALKNNKALAAIFLKMADCYRYLGNEQRYRAVAYENVSKLLYNMKEDIGMYAKNIQSLDTIKGIGESIAEKITEYLHTGKIAVFDKLKEQVPYDLLDLMAITGIGPATVRILHDKSGINDKKELIRALETRALDKSKSLSKAKIDNMRKALKLSNDKKRLPYDEAKKIAVEFLEEIKKIAGVQHVSLAGSLRRKADTIGDIDIVMVVAPAYRQRVVQKLVGLPQVSNILMKGTTKVSVILKYKSFQADMRLVNEDEYGAAMLYSTGSREHTIHLRTIALKKGYIMNEYGIFDRATHQALAGATEEDMYRCLGLKFIPPEKRLDKGEIEKAFL